MSLKLSLHTHPVVPLEAENISPDKIVNLDNSAICQLELLHGKEKVPLSDFFDVDGDGDNNIEIKGDLSLVKYVGAQMTTGRITVNGNIGAHLGAGMQDGEIIVNGDAADWVGPEITGGRIVIKGDAGHLAGSVYRGGSIGMQGGEIIIHGNAKNEVGHGMRNGLIVIGGNCGDFTGLNMLAGTIITLGQLGIRTGAGIKRGTIISMCDAPVLPTFSYACLYRPAFIPVLLKYIRGLGMDINDKFVNGQYHRWSGDAVEINRGELLFFSG